MTTTYNVPSAQPDLVCLSHLRWDFVFQRPQHLMKRFANRRRVFYIEEPTYEPNGYCGIRSQRCSQTGVEVVTSNLPSGRSSSANSVLRRLLGDYLRSRRVHQPCAWFYTPMAVEFFPDQVPTCAVVYDCMDELSMFRGAPKELQQMEAELLVRADLVFTGGVSLFEAKRMLHRRVYPFPSGVDFTHFAQARSISRDCDDQRSIPHPRLGYAGVIDERIDLPLIAEAARRRPDWHFIMVGPTAKIDPAVIPKAPNLHWLGRKDYQDLPAYFAGWDLAMMPFARNDATRFISPTKTPEYLAAGLPVVSTSIRDVIRPYGELGLARIADTPEEFVAAAEQSMHGMSLKWRERSDDFLQGLSWDAVWGSMDKLICEVTESKLKLGKPVGAVSLQGEVARARTNL